MTLKYTVIGPRVFAAGTTDMNPDSHLVISQSRKLFEMDDSVGLVNFVQFFVYPTTEI